MVLVNSTSRYIHVKDWYLHRSLPSTLCANLWQFRVIHRTDRINSISIFFESQFNSIILFQNWIESKSDEIVTKIVPVSTYVLCQLYPLSCISSPLNLYARPTQKERLPLACVVLLVTLLLVPEAYRDGVAVQFSTCLRLDIQL